MKIKCLQLYIAKLGDLKQQLFVSGIEPDLAFFQEYWQKKPLEMEGCASSGANPFTKQGMGCGTQVFYKKTKLKKVKYIPMLSADKEAWPIRTRKSATLVHLTTGDRNLIAISLHGMNNWPSKKAAPLERQMKDVMKVLSEFPKDYPVIFAGDFNTSTDKRLGIVINSMRSNGFINSYSAKHENGDTLDWVWVRGCVLSDTSHADGISDHPALVFTVDF
jgi:endonuclease/exonuclease/phosphatase (EEP) superfamily protein YafD